MIKIALFPLNIFLLPGDYTQLYIFEDRYKQLINDCEKKGMRFGIPCTNKLNTKNLGSEVELVEVVKRYPNGDLDIIVKATGIFHLSRFFFQQQERLYPAGEVEMLPLEIDFEASEDLMADFKTYLIKFDLVDSDLINKNRFTLFEIANAMQLNEVEKMEVVHLVDPARIQQYLVGYIRYLELLQEQESNVYQNLYLN